MGVFLSGQVDLRKLITCQTSSAFFLYVYRTCVCETVWCLVGEFPVVLTLSHMHTGCVLAPWETPPANRGRRRDEGCCSVLRTAETDRNM